MTASAAQVIALEYGPRSIRFNPECGLAIVPRFEVFQQVKDKIPAEYDRAVLAGRADFDAARGAITGRNRVLLFDDNDLSWRSVAEEAVRSVGAHVIPPPAVITALNVQELLELRLAPREYVLHPTADDGNDREIARQEIPFTDFPLRSTRLYLVNDGRYRVLMLPSEY